MQSFRPAVAGAALPALAAAFALVLWLWPTLGGVPSPPATPAPPRAEIERGRDLLAQYQCGACHRIEGVSQARGSAGPPLARFGLRSYIAGQLPNTPAVLAQWIVEPGALRPGTPMPAMGVTARDAQAMAAYLGSLR